MAKYSAFGTLLKRGDGAGTEAFTTVGGVMDITGPAYTTDTIDVTAHDSANAFEEHVPGVKRSGDVTFDVAYDPADATHHGANSIRQDWEDRVERNFELVLTDTANQTISFAAFVTGFEFGMPVNGALTASITLKPTGAPTFA